MIQEPEDHCKRDVLFIDHSLLPCRGSDQKTGAVKNERIKRLDVYAEKVKEENWKKATK